MTTEELADIIEKNPNCQFEIDNDGWNILNPETGDLIADSSEVDDDAEWYNGGHLYGAGIASAMVVLLNRRGFKLTAGPC